MDFVYTLRTASKAVLQAAFDGGVILSALVRKKERVNGKKLYSIPKEESVDIIYLNNYNINANFVEIRPFLFRTRERTTSGWMYGERNI